MKDNLISWEEAVLWLKGQPDQRELVLACYYDDPLAESAERFYRSTEWRAVQKLLTNLVPGKVLDVGAGRGISSYALARDGWKVTALEPDSSPLVGATAIKQLAGNSLAITVVEEYGETLPFADSSFELVYGRAIMHHAHNLKKFCRELVRVLKPGGMLIATREHVISRKKDLQVFLDSHPLHSLYGGENAFLLDEYLDALRDAGLKIISVIAPYESDINLFPANLESLRIDVSKRLGVKIPRWIFENLVIPLLNHLVKKPGRLFSFVGVKP